MRLVGARFAGQSEDSRRISLLRADGLSRDEAQAQRDTLIQGYRWILVDVYQDIAPDDYELIAAIAGRSPSCHDGDPRSCSFPPWAGGPGRPAGPLSDVETVATERAKCPPPPVEGQATSSTVITKRFLRQARASSSLPILVA